jgi:ribonuclease P protein component
MISKAHRFHGFTSLRAVYSRGQTVRGSALALKYMPNPRRGSYRAAVVVSRKTHKSAVVRNRIRRRIYEIIRSYEPDVTGPFDIVITVYSDQVAEVPSQSLESMVQDLFKKAGILRRATESDTHGIVIPKEHR